MSQCAGVVQINETFATIRPMQSKRRIRRIVIVVIGLVTLLACGWLLNTGRQLLDPRGQSFIQWWIGDDDVKQSLITTQREACPGAPFVLPADGFVGLLYNDPRGPHSGLNPHQGIDIFSSQPVGVTPVYAAYDGYVRREAHWTSALIQRVPQDPLTGEQIWLYYAHMADEQGSDFIEPAFERGVSEVFVEQGTLLGYVGNYDGNIPSRIGAHLHFSLVKDDNGAYMNELDFDNTLDLTPYLGMEVNYDSADGRRVTCVP
ncbi:MAG: M23 family metallopeptidase [Anaerolineae bacterium]|nr:M23 family metallopeptidase [Anaerolineae bacterium]